MEEYELFYWVDGKGDEGRLVVLVIEFDFGEVISLFLIFVVFFFCCKVLFLFFNDRSMKLLISLVVILKFVWYGIVLRFFIVWVMV